jgi:hypothetical protein
LHTQPFAVVSHLPDKQHSWHVKNEVSPSFVSQDGVQLSISLQLQVEQPAALEQQA